MRRPRLTFPLLALLAALAATLGLSACGGGSGPARADTPHIVVTHAILGSVVSELVGDRARVTVLIPSGADPHEWRPSAKDVSELTKADVVVANGLGLEEGLDDALAQARRDGTPVIDASDAVRVRRIAAGDPAAAEHGAGAEDPHYWTDPRQMRRVVDALAPEIGRRLGIDLAPQARRLDARLAAVDAEAARILAVVPAGRRTLVTGHESLGYFADRYGFRVVGTVIPGLSSQGQVSASGLADLKAAIAREDARVVFGEIGTPQAVVRSIADETGARVVELPSHTLPADGSYLTYIRDLARTVAGAEAGG